MSFLNISAHPAASWSTVQRRAAEVFGPVVDIDCALLRVEPATDTAAICAQAEQVVREALRYRPLAAMVAGEPTLCFAIVRRLQRVGVVVYAATTARESVEVVEPDGCVVKHSIFRFVRFRRYPEV